MTCGEDPDIDGVADALGLAEITALPTGTELPSTGALVTGEMIGHAKHNHQVKVRLLAIAGRGSQHGE